jgi:hypothetical protein
MRSCVRRMSNQRFLMSLLMTVWKTLWICLICSWVTTTSVIYSLSLTQLTA